MPFFFEKPLGTRDLLGPELERIEKIIETVRQDLRLYDYQEVKSPIIEYYETIGLLSKKNEEKLVKFFDASGKNVSLRPDFTAALARLVKSNYSYDASFPLRLMYVGDIYENDGLRGLREVKQIGLELLGESDLSADAEIIAILGKILEKISSEDFRISLGHAKILEILLEELACPLENRERIYESLLRRNYVDFMEEVRLLDLQERERDYLESLITIKASLSEVLDYKNWFSSKKWQDIFEELEILEELLGAYGVLDYINFDFSLLGKRDYYTGLIFYAFSANNPYPVASGGRYDDLLENFALKSPATGFALDIYALESVAREDLLEKRERYLLKTKLSSLKKALDLAQVLRRDKKQVSLSFREDLPPAYEENFTKVKEIFD